MKTSEIFKKLASTTSWSGREPKSVADTNIFGDSPLHTVCTWGDVDSASRLLLEGAQVNARGEDGKTPIFNAVMSRNVMLVELLIRAGADPLLKDDDELTAIEFARLVRCDAPLINALVRGPRRR